MAGDWECPECGSGNTAALSVCEFCDCPLGAGPVALAQASELGLWECSDCGSQNSAVLSICEFCGSPCLDGFVARAQAAMDDEDEELSLEPSIIPAQRADFVAGNPVDCWECSFCSSENAATFSVCEFCNNARGAELSPSPAHEEEELLMAAREWADARRECLVDELSNLQFCSLDLRKQRLRALQLELHPDKQPPAAGPERRVQAQALFLMVQHEWEAGGVPAASGAVCRQQGAAEDMAKGCHQRKVAEDLTKVSARVEEFSKAMAASEDEMKAYHEAQEATQRAVSRLKTFSRESARFDFLTQLNAATVELLKEEDEDDCLFANLQEAAKHYASRQQAKHRLWLQTRMFRGRESNVEISIQVMSTTYEISASEDWMLYDVKEELEKLSGIPSHRQKLITSVRNHPQDIQRLSELTSDRRLCLTMTPVLKKHTDYVEVAKAVQQDGTSLQHACAALQADRTIVRAAVRQCWQSIQYASGDFLSDRGLFLMAVKQDPSALLYAAPELRADVLLITPAVNSSWQLLPFLAPELHADPKVILAALACDVRALSFADKLLRDHQFCLAALRINGLAFQYVAQYWRSDLKLLLEALKRDRRAITYASPSLVSHPKVVAMLKAKYNFQHFQD